MQVRDKQFGLLVPIGSYGNYELQIRDVQAFLLKLVGVSQSYSISDLREYLYPLVERETKDAIAELAVEADVSHWRRSLTKYRRLFRIIYLRSSFPMVFL